MTSYEEEKACADMFLNALKDEQAKAAIQNSIKTMVRDILKDDLTNTIKKDRKEAKLTTYNLDLLIYCGTWIILSVIMVVGIILEH